MSTVRWRMSLARSATVSSKYEPESRVTGGWEGSAVGEVEELDLRGGVEGEAEVVGPVEGPAQHVAGIALERRAVEVDHVAEDPGHLGLGGVPVEPRPWPCPCQGRSWKVLASGRASTSLSWTRLNPSMADPSKVIPSSRAFSSSAGVMLKVLGVPARR
jgi:hypothetical protein